MFIYSKLKYNKAVIDKIDDIFLENYIYNYLAPLFMTRDLTISFNACSQSHH